MTRRRVVVTGMGIVSPVGIGLAAAWDSIRNARSGVARDHALRLLDVSDADRRRGEGFRRRQVPVGEGSAALRHLRPLRPRRDDGGGHRCRSRRLRRRQGARRRLHRLRHRRPAADRGDDRKRISPAACARSRPFFVPGSIVNMVAGLVSIHYGYQGPNLAHRQRLLDGEPQPRRSRAPDRVRRRRRDDRRRHRGHGQRARHRRLLRRARPFDAQRRPRDGEPARGTSIATASCRARAPASWCSRSTSTPRRAAPGSIASSPATE